MKSVLILIGSILGGSSAFACPDFSGTFDITSMTSDGQTQQIPAGKSAYVITQKACLDVNVAQTGSDGGIDQKFIVDGKPHPFSSAPDAGVIFVEVSRFNGNKLIADMQIDSAPNHVIGTIEYSIDASGKNLTQSMNAPGSTFSAIAVRR